MRWAGLVRNVMIGREGLHRDVLLQLLADAGGKRGASHLATGNLTFETPEHSIRAVVRRLEAGIASVIGRREPVVFRSAEWLREFVASDPFADHDGSSEHLVALLPLDAAPLDAAKLGPSGATKILRVTDHEVIGVRPDQRAPHVLGLAERAAGVKATSRGWSTLVRLSRVE